jgi:hypothetical protein
MKWKKQGIIFVPEAGKSDLMSSHAAIPFAEVYNKEMLRIYFSSRNRNGKSLPFSLDVDLNEPSRILSVSSEPLFCLGELGTFDDSGIMPSCVVQDKGRKYLYYIGWNPQVSVSYRLSIGLAISEDNGSTFKKYSIGPICDRDINEPYFNTAPYVIKDGSEWKMWYISCTKWHIINGHTEPQYHVKCASSEDGIHWNKKGIICIDYDETAEAIGRPSVIKENNIYKMWYSYRFLLDYRTDRQKSYRLGYAESKDGIKWERKDSEVGIAKSEEGWDSQMIEYCHVINLKGKKYMFYNGNGFGKSGFGYAVLEDRNVNA